MLPSRLMHNRIEAGCDEAGRGCLAGPVFAAAVILPLDFAHEDIRDSKLLTQTKRDLMASYIKEHALSYSVSFCHPGTIDRLNILNASFAAMHAAIKKLKHRPELLLIDGNRFNSYKGIAHKCIVKGDNKVASIAAASILAKTSRDRYMQRKHREYPQYHWKTNKGYPTAEHRAAILEYGLSPIHRRSFQQYADPNQLTIAFQAAR